MHDIVYLILNNIALATILFFRLLCWIRPRNIIAAAPPFSQLEDQNFAVRPLWIITLVVAAKSDSSHLGCT
jgi:hypothetical protein